MGGVVKYLLANDTLVISDIFGNHGRAVAIQIDLGGQAVSCNIYLWGFCEVEYLHNCVSTHHHFKSKLTLFTPNPEQAQPPLEASRDCSNTVIYM
jgi:hypothetical protein